MGVDDREQPGLRRATPDEVETLDARVAADGAPPLWPQAAVVVQPVDVVGGAALAWDDRLLAAELAAGPTPLDATDLAALGEPLVWLQTFRDAAERQALVGRRFATEPQADASTATTGPTVLDRLRALPVATHVTGPTSVYSSRYADALAFAAVAHADQKKKGTAQPYAPHLLRASSWVWANGGTEDQAIGALLHDALEDIGAELRPLIEARFGPDVLAIVEACSDTDQPGAKPPWLERKVAHIDELARAPHAALLVIAADKLDNLRQLTADVRATGSVVWTSFKSGRVGAVWYYRSVVRALEDHPDGLDPAVVDELHSAVDELVVVAKS